MLSNSRVVGFVATAMPEASKRFYAEVLGLTLVEDTPFAIVLASKNATIRVQKAGQVQPPPYTSLGWEVDDLVATARALAGSGVQFERFEGLEQDDSGIWNVPGGAKVAWFKDPDGNLLSLTQSA